MADEVSGRVVGIDLGTTNSLVAFMQGDSPVVIPGEDGDRLVPSVVAFNDQTTEGFLVGNAARATLLTDSSSAVYSAKRLMGRDLADIEEELKLFPFKLAEGLKPGEVLKLNVGGLSLTPPEISAYVLLQLKKNARTLLWRSGDEGGHHRPRLFQRRATAGDEGCWPYCRA